MSHEEVVKALRAMIESGEAKTKGAYEALPFEELGWQKNHSAMVISMAVAADLLGLCSYKDFILNHKEPYDFTLRTKVKRTDKLMYVTIDEFSGVEMDEQIQNICRYIPVVNGGKLVKIMPPLASAKDPTAPRRQGIDKEWNVRVCNDMKDFDWGLDYEYYFAKAEKLINAIGDEEEDDDE